MKELDFLDRLKVLRMYSHKNRMKWFMKIFFGKISHVFIRGYVVTFTSSEPRGVTILLNKIARNTPVPVRKARESSLDVKGAQLCSILPVPLKNFHSDSVDSLKNSFLKSVPDQPIVSGLNRAADINSLPLQIPITRNSSCLYLCLCLCFHIG